MRHSITVGIFVGIQILFLYQVCFLSTRLQVEAPILSRPSKQPKQSNPMPV